MAARKSSSADDDYWSSSSAQKMKKKVNLFDDNVDSNDVKQFLSSRNVDFDNDDDDTINWDGSAATDTTKVEFSSRSARYRAPEPSSSAPQRGTVAGIPIGSNTSRRSPATQMGKPVAGDFPLTAAYSTLSDHITKPSQSRATPTHSEVAKLEAQVNSLKRTLHNSEKERYAQIPPKQMIQRMVTGQSYSLEGYKAKEQKISLLDEAIKCHDGNAITAVLVFVMDTLKPSIFQRLLLQRPVAVEHYINYLRLRSQHDRLDNILAMLGRFEEAAMLKYKQALVTSNPETRIRSLQTCQRAHFTNLDAGLNFEAGMIQQHVSILERQLPIENADKLEEQKGLPPFRDFPRKASIIGQPVITTLFYCSKYHFNLTENNLASPVGIKKAHGLSDAQYVWTVIRALVMTKRFREIETLFQHKGWFGGNKMKAVIPFDRVVRMLNSLQAPRHVKNIYCKLIEDVHLRLETAQKSDCHECLVETYVQLRDRQSLVVLQGKLKPSSQEWFFVRDALSNNTVKWKN